jgi:hypothetical protein
MNKGFSDDFAGLACPPYCHPNDDFGGEVPEFTQFWTYALVEARLIEAMRLAWRDEPGRWPFSGDGPWHLIVRDFGDHGAHDPAAIPRLPLTRKERARMDEARGWLAIVSGDGAKTLGEGGDAKLIVAVMRKLAAHQGAGRGRVDWHGVMRAFRLPRGLGAIQKRYSRAIGKITAANARARLAIEYPDA